MYGVTGNYLLHVLWIAIITLVVVLNAIYLRKLHVDISDRWLSIVKVGLLCGTCRTV